MPVKRKNAVKKRFVRQKTEQETQAAAIAEIESFLNLTLTDNKFNNNQSNSIKIESVNHSRSCHHHTSRAQNKIQKNDAVKKNINTFQKLNEKKELADRPSSKFKIANIPVSQAKTVAIKSPYLVDLKQTPLPSTNSTNDLPPENHSRQIMIWDKSSAFINSHFNINWRHSWRETENIWHQTKKNLLKHYQARAEIFNQLAIVNLTVFIIFIFIKVTKYPLKCLLFLYVWSKYLTHDLILFIHNVGIVGWINNFATKIISSILSVFAYRRTELAVEPKPSTFKEISDSDIDIVEYNNTVKSKERGLKGFLTNFHFSEGSISFLPPFFWRRQLVAFVVLALLLVLPVKAIHYFNIFQSVKGSVLGESEQAVSSLQDALSQSENFNFVNAADSFARAAENFSSAEVALSSYSNLIAVANIAPSSKVRVAATGDLLVRSATQAAKAGHVFSLALNSLQLPNLMSTDLGMVEVQKPPLTQRLNDFSTELEQALPYLQELSDIMRDINVVDVQSLPLANAPAIAEQVSVLKNRIDLIVAGTKEIIDTTNIAVDFLGHKTDTRYLLIFQNNAEMRASGGFIGSYAVVDFRRGEIKNIDVPAGGSYDLQGGLHERISAPQPLHLINSLWEFQDANWWPDWPTSAKKIQWFFENGWGSSVDGVIAIDPTFVENFLDVIGGITMDDAGTQVVDGTNFYEIAQNRENLSDPDKPKTIIKELVEKIATQLPKKITADNFSNIIQVVAANLSQKHILFYLNDETQQNFISANGWDGSIQDTNGDYLSVINTNIAGAKTDRKIRQTIHHEASVMPDGGIIDTVTIKREHTAGKGEAYAGVRNVNYLRVYVPEGSELLTATGFSEPDAIYFDEPAVGASDDPELALVEKNTSIDEISGVRIYNEFNKTVFANWTQVDPGQTINIVLKYKLPFKINSFKQDVSFWQNLVGQNDDLSSYSLLLQKQPGSVSSNFISDLSLPKNMKIIWHGTDGQFFDAGWQITNDLTTDHSWGVVIKKIK